MELFTLAERIGLPQAAIDAIRGLTEVDGLIADFHADSDALIRRIKEQPQPYERCLRLFLGLAADAHDRYAEMGIPDDIYFDTMGDIAVWCGNCLRDHGVYGLAETGWLQLHVRQRIYKLGRLQFEPISIHEDVELPRFSARKGEIALSVHIQQGGTLSHDECMESYRRALKFFRGITDLFFCHSWLLSPRLRDLLPVNSNIIRFQSDFDLYDFDEGDRQCEERVFVVKRDDPLLYQGDTSLQRSVKQFLLSGGKVGTSGGIHRLKL